MSIDPQQKITEVERLIQDGQLEKARATVLEMFQKGTDSSAALEWYERITYLEQGMSDESIYVLCSVDRQGADYSELLATLQDVKKPDEVIFPSLSDAYHGYPRLRKKHLAIASIIFIDLSIPSFAIPEEIQRTKEYLPKAVFVLYTNQYEYLRCSKELPEQWAKSFLHYYKVYKDEGELRVTLREVLDRARSTAVQKVKAWADGKLSGEEQGRIGHYEEEQYRVRLRQNLASLFNKDELCTLCFDLGIQYDNLPSTLDGMARELVANCERHGRLSELAEKGKRLRPNALW
jgi:hypothetical protein